VKFRALAVAATAAALTWGALPAQQPESTAARNGTANRHPWTPGERFEYRLKLGMFNVGRATLEVVGIDTIRGVPCYHVRMTISGRALVYRLTDTLESWFGVHDMISRRFEQNGNENGRVYSRRYVIDAARALWVRNGVDSGITVQQPLDEASFFYFARTVPLENDQSYSFSRYFIFDRNPVTLRVIGRQTITTDAGRFATVVVRPTFKSRGLFAEGGEATVWFSDDAHRIPVRIRSRMSIGTLDLTLRSR
jgi:hypothetical protein